MQECSAHLGTWPELFETFQFPFLTLLPAPLAIASFQEENLVAQILSFIIQAGRSMYSCILYLLQCHLSSTVLSWWSTVSPLCTFAARSKPNIGVHYEVMRASNMYWVSRKFSQTGRDQVFMRGKRDFRQFPLKSSRVQKRQDAAKTPQWNLNVKRPRGKELPSLLPASAAEREKRRVKPGNRERKRILCSHHTKETNWKGKVLWVHMWHLLLPFSDASSMCKVTPVSLSC